MKTNLSLLACLLIICTFIPATANALNNNIEISLGIGSGEQTVPGVSGADDTESLEFNVFFTHYFQGLETNDSPYGAREFLQHPSQIGAGLITYDFKATDDVGDTLDYKVNAIGFGGFYYTQSEENATGVGITYLSQEYDLSFNIGGIPLSSEGDSKAIALSFHQYLSKAARLELTYLMKDSDSNGTSHDETLISIGASGLIDNIWLSGYYLNGDDDWPDGYTDDDISGFGIEVGVYVNQKTGLFFSYESETTDDGTSKLEVTDISFAGDFHVNEKTHIKGTLTLHEEDDPTFMTIEETILTAQAGFYF